MLKITIFACFCGLIRSFALFFACGIKRYRGRVARQRSAKPPTAVRICSVPQKAKACSFAFFIPDFMATYSRWIALSAFILLATACFLPWTFHADIQKTFTGFYTENNIYGKPAKFLLILGGLTALFAFIPKLWLKRTALFMSGLNVAYGIKTFLMFGACYQGYCPEKKIGLFLMLICTILLMIAAMFPAGEIKQQPAVESFSGGEENADTHFPTDRI
jgi:hypothetical protein